MTDEATSSTSKPGKNADKKARQFDLSAILTVGLFHVKNLRDFFCRKHV
jgi:hypothetical protein